MKSLFALLILSSISLGGCAKDTGVVLAKDHDSFFEGAVYEGESKVLGEDKTGSEQYRVFQQAATGFIPGSVVRSEVEEQASKYCDNLNKKLKILQERNAVPPYVFGNFPRAELLFVCLPKPTTISLEDQLYIKLTNLKKLHDDGTLTKEEFDQQKAKILNPK